MQRYIDDVYMSHMAMYIIHVTEPYIHLQLSKINNHLGIVLSFRLRIHRSSLFETRGMMLRAPAASKVDHRPCLVLCNIAITQTCSMRVKYCIRTHQLSASYLTKKLREHAGGIWKNNEKSNDLWDVHRRWFLGVVMLAVKFSIAVIVEYIGCLFWTPPNEHGEHLTGINELIDCISKTISVAQNNIELYAY